MKRGKKLRQGKYLFWFAVVVTAAFLIFTIVPLFSENVFFAPAPSFGDKQSATQSSGGESLGNDLGSIAPGSSGGGRDVIDVDMCPLLSARFIRDSCSISGSSYGEFTLSSDEGQSVIYIQTLYGTVTIELISASDTSANIRVLDTSGRVYSKEINEGETKVVGPMLIRLIDADEDVFGWTVNIEVSEARDFIEEEIYLSDIEPTYQVELGTTWMVELINSSERDGFVLVDVSSGSYAEQEWINLGDVKKVNGLAIEVLDIDGEYVRGESSGSAFLRVANGQRIVREEGRKMFLGDLIFGPAIEGDLFMSTWISPEGSGYQDDIIELNDLFDERIFRAEIVSSGRGVLNIDGETYYVDYRFETIPGDGENRYIKLTWGEGATYGDVGTQRDTFYCECDAVVEEMCRGVTLSERVYADYEMYPSKLELTSDGGYAIFGDNREGYAHTFNLLKLNSQKDVQFNRTYNGALAPYLAFGKQLDDGKFILGGSEDIFDEEKGILIKTDSNGDELWRFNSQQISINDSGFYDAIKFGDSQILVLGRDGRAELPRGLWVLLDYETGYFLSRYYRDIMKSIKRTVDGGYILAGAEQTDEGREYIVILEKWNERGEFEWRTEISGIIRETYWGELSEGPFLDVLTDGYIAAFHSHTEGNTTFVKTDLNGNILWENRMDALFLTSLERTFDNGFIVSALPYEFIKFNSWGREEWRWYSEDVYINPLDIKQVGANEFIGLARTGLGIYPAPGLFEISKECGDPTQLTSCGTPSGGWQSNTTYYLANDVTAELGQACFTIGDDVSDEDIELNCQGNKITGSTGFAVNVASSGVNIQECVIESQYGGIKVLPWGGALEIVTNEISAGQVGISLQGNSSVVDLNLIKNTPVGIRIGGDTGYSGYFEPISSINNLIFGNIFDNVQIAIDVSQHNRAPQHPSSRNNICSPLACRDWAYPSGTWGNVCNITSSGTGGRGSCL